MRGNTEATVNHRSSDQSNQMHIPIPQCKHIHWKPQWNFFNLLRDSGESSGKKIWTIIEKMRWCRYDKLISPLILSEFVVVKEHE